MVETAVVQSVCVCVLCMCVCRIAFQLLSFADVISSGTATQPTGPSMLAARCFSAAGYTVVPVSLTALCSAYSNIVI